ncbi:MAG: hypothetical protein KAU62_04360 [Candidatus Heimdallarchaeota archaeon]|nr:hypothetical protein [Candidatus Heimdallarchaeota archaeon]MCG3255298.1 hypothetical protein [Candidatus Heimdallarchaeota archaeon]MCK4610371.1 hypothetical protein [Candidatus Heimdallarchaeota archaeon]
MTLIAILVSINYGQNFVIANNVEDFTYNNNLEAPLELSWVMTTFYLVYDTPEDYIWQITSEINVTQGDIFKIKFLVDPDNLNISNYDDLYTTTETWAEFYLNSVLLGDDASLIAFNDINPYLDYFPVKFIYPQTVQVGGAEISTFDYLYDDLKQYEFSMMGMKYKLTNKAKLFSIEAKIHLIVMVGLEETDITQDSKVIYNKEWGVLSSYELHLTRITDSVVEEVEILLEITDEDIKVAPFGWIAGISVLLIAGVIVIRRKRKLIYK